MDEKKIDALIQFKNLMTSSFDNRKFKKKNENQADWISSLKTDKHEHGHEHSCEFTVCFNNQNQKESYKLKVRKAGVDLLYDGEDSIRDCVFFDEYNSRVVRAKDGANGFYVLNTPIKYEQHEKPSCSFSVENIGNVEGLSGGGENVEHIENRVRDLKNTYLNRIDVNIDDISLNTVKTVSEKIARLYAFLEKRDKTIFLQFVQLKKLNDQISDLQTQLDPIFDGHHDAMYNLIGDTSPTERIINKGLQSIFLIRIYSECRQLLKKKRKYHELLVDWSKNTVDVVNTIREDYVRQCKIEPFLSRKILDKVEYSSFLNFETPSNFHVVLGHYIDIAFKEDYSLSENISISENTNVIIDDILKNNCFCCVYSVKELYESHGQGIDISKFKKVFIYAPVMRKKEAPYALCCPWCVADYFKDFMNDKVDGFAKKCYGVAIHKHGGESLNLYELLKQNKVDLDKDEWISNIEPHRKKATQGGNRGRSWLSTALINLFALIALSII